MGEVSLIAHPRLGLRFRIRGTVIHRHACVFMSFTKQNILLSLNWLFCCLTLESAASCINYVYYFSLLVLSSAGLKCFYSRHIYN